MSEEKHVMVPQSDLDKLEEARVELWRLFESREVLTIYNTRLITDTMWRLAHKKYPEVPHG